MSAHAVHVHLPANCLGQIAQTTKKKNRSNGVTTLVKKSLKYEISATCTDQAGRMLLIEIKLHDKVFVIGNVYALTKNKPIFFDVFFNFSLYIFQSMT